MVQEVNMSIKSLVSTDVEKLKSIKVNDKMASTFKRIFIYIAIVVGSLIITGAAAVVGFRNMYRIYYMQDNLQGEIRINVQAYMKASWWALTTRNEETQTEQIANIQEKIPELQANLDDLSEVYTNQTNLTAVQNDINTLSTLTDQVVELFAAGTMTETGPSNSDEIYDLMNGDVTTTVKALASDLKAVSQDSFSQAETAFNSFIILLYVMAVISIITIVTTILYIKDISKKLGGSILGPVVEISKAADDMSNGILDIEINYKSEDELGKMASDLDRATTNIKEIVEDISVTLDRVAGGDFTHGTDNPELYKADYIPIRESLENITNKLSETIGRVRESSSQVSQGASNMSQGASDLANGATDQAAAVQELTASVATVTEQTKEMADSAQQGIDMAERAKSDAENSAHKMKLVTDAMTRITEASNQIEQVTNEIESIAKQTQLLALNASIEAARAGDAGKGFAVVAEEISALANESTEAAKNTHQLISDTMEEIRNGNIVVDETKEALLVVQETVNSVTEMMQESGAMAQNQAEAMEEISKGIDQISNVVQNNSATAEESSAVSLELSEQSESLNELISQFSVKE